jgi:hypothetical protein
MNSWQKSAVKSQTQVQPFKPKAVPNKYLTQMKQVQPQVQSQVQRTNLLNKGGQGTPTKLGNMQTRATAVKTNYSQPSSNPAVKTTTAVGSSNIGNQSKQPASATSAPPATTTNYGGKGNPYNEIAYLKGMYEGSQSSGQKAWAANEAKRYYGMLDPEEAKKVEGFNATQLKDYINQRNAQNPTTPATPATPAEEGRKDFEFAYNNMSYDDAIARAGQQLDPLYQRALEALKGEKYQNELNAGEVASKRGLSHSGLAADQLTKIAIASQGQAADLQGKRASQAAEMAQAMVDRDQDRADRLRQQAFAEYMGMQDLDYRDKEFDYREGRDEIADGRYDKEWEYQVGRDKVADGRYDQEWAYQQQRDKVGDSQWDKTFQHQKDRDKVADQQWRMSFDQQVKQQAADNAWREKTFNQMSASEKAQLAWNKQQFGEQMAWEIEANNRADARERDSWEFQAGLQGFPGE